MHKKKKQAPEDSGVVAARVREDSEVAAARVQEDYDPDNNFLMNPVYVKSEQCWVPFSDVLWAQEDYTSHMNPFYVDDVVVGLVESRDATQATSASSSAGAFVKLQWQ